MQAYTISRNALLIRDRSGSAPSLNSLFQDSHAMFRMRVQHLGNTARITSDEESDTLRIMLDALIYAKQQIQQENQEVS
ncbi:hypothetical protein EBR96_10250 [bacterium]|nr:hypothetical protein [bacterium]